MRVEPIPKKLATDMVVAHHYLHRAPVVGFAYGLFDDDRLLGVVTFGIPPYRTIQKGACPSDPSAVIELNRLWVHDDAPKNTESWFVSRALKLLPPKIVVSYADTAAGHVGYIYRALNFFYAGWTDMERKTPRFHYVVPGGGHSRSAFRGEKRNFVGKVRKLPKVKYWTVTGDGRERAKLKKLAGWPLLCWKVTPPPEAYGGLC